MGAASKIVTRLTVGRVASGSRARFRTGVEILPFKTMSTVPAFISSTAAAAICASSSAGMMSSGPTSTPLSSSARPIPSGLPMRIIRSTIPWSRADSTRLRSSTRSPPTTATVEAVRRPAISMRSITFVNSFCSLFWVIGSFCCDLLFLPQRSQRKFFFNSLFSAAYLLLVINPC